MESERKIVSVSGLRETHDVERKSLLNHEVGELLKTKYAG